MARVAEVALLVVALLGLGIAIGTDAPVEQRAGVASTAIGLLLYLSRRARR